MANTILVVVEQREGKLNRVSWETVAAAQAIAAATGWTAEGAVFGSGISSIAGEVAGKKLSKAYAIESPKLAQYTPDGTVAALKQFIQQKQPTLVLMPHTYQVRDFAPQLATAMDRTLISDVVAFRKEGEAPFYTANVSGQVRRGCLFCFGATLVRYLSVRRVSRRQGGSRIVRRSGGNNQC